MKAGHLAVFSLRKIEFRKFGKCICLICQKTIAVKKISNIKQHYETHHNHYNNFTEKHDKTVAQLRKELTKQSTFFTRKVEKK